MVDKKLGKNLLKLIFSNIITILSGIVIGFVLPMILDFENYAYFRMYSLYLGYVGIFHLGFIDGIYLKYGGISYDKLDKPIFRMYVRFLTIFQLIVALIMILVSILFIGNEMFLILIFVAIMLFCTNITTLFQFVSQITSRFNELSIRSILDSVFKIVIVCSFFVVHKYIKPYFLNYEIYIISTISTAYLLLGWYIFTYRDIIFNKAISIKDSKTEIISLFKLGLPLLICNFITIIIVSIDRQFVSSLFEPKIYAVYAFAYSLISLVTVATSAISTILYPTLKMQKEEDMKKNFELTSKILMLIVFLGMFSYFLLIPIVNLIIPKYNDSLDYLRILFPALVTQSLVTVVILNFYKTLNMMKPYLIIGLVIMVLSCLFNVLAYFIFNTPQAISWASCITLFLWYIISQSFLVKKLDAKVMKNILYLIVMTFAFYISSFMELYYIGGVIYLSIYVIISFTLYKNEIMAILSKLFKSKKG